MRNIASLTPGLETHQRGMQIKGSLSNYVKSIAGSKVAALVVGDDFPAGGATWPARIGTALPTIAAGKVTTIDALNGRRAPVFSAGAAATGYTLPVSCAEYWAVARCDLVGNFLSVESIIGGLGSGPRLLGATGTRNLINDCTITRDGASAITVDDAIHVWRATDTPSADGRYVGNHAGAASTNWVGPIGLVMACSSALTADEAARMLSLFRWYYRF